MFIGGILIMQLILYRKFDTKTPTVFKVKYKNKIELITEDELKELIIKVPSKERNCKISKGRITMKSNKGTRGNFLKTDVYNYKSQLHLHKQINNIRNGILESKDYLITYNNKRYKANEKQVKSLIRRIVPQNRNCRIAYNRVELKIQAGKSSHLTVKENIIKA